MSFEQAAHGNSSMQVITATYEEELLAKLRLWISEMEAKSLRVNMGKTKIMLSGPNLNSLRNSSRYPCSVYRVGLGKNSIISQVLIYGYISGVVVSTES